MTRAALPPRTPGPVWDVAKLFPDQGQWDEGDYLELNRSTNHLIEFDNGTVEVLEMPTRSHRRIVLYLDDGLNQFAGEKGLGEVLVAPYPVRLWRGKFREPDVVFVLAEHADHLGEDYAEGADLVMEVVSDDRRRDLETKRKEHARAKIAEYWVIDPRDRRVTVFKRRGSRYTTAGTYGEGEKAASVLLSGFEVDVTDLSAAARRGRSRR
jgi:Uma2 family endonuclease